MLRTALILLAAALAAAGALGVWTSIHQWRNR